MKRISTSLLLTTAAFSSQVAMAVENSDRPNILWLTFEDASDYTLGCYGNRFSTTPNIDSLARNGIMFTNAYSNAPQSSPARSALITGSYPATYGMELHRGRVTTPERIFYPQYLREAGYFCTNNQKTDYNTFEDHNAIWDECGSTATYNSFERRRTQPFFAVFNSSKSHMTRLSGTHIEGRRDFSKEGIFLGALDLPGHLPDLYSIRSDYALQLEGINDIDSWVGIILSDLREKGLAENTIIFIFSDHGGCQPRGKGYAYETGLSVPMIAYFPPKLEYLAHLPLRESNDRLVCFADLAPTVLSLIGAPIPEYMQGIPFMGDSQTSERKYQYGYVGNHAGNYQPIRTVSDGRMKYIRRYIPYKNDALINEFQWQMPGNLAWDMLYFSGGAKTLAECCPFEIEEGQMLFDLENDPWELNNLANDPRYKTSLVRLQAELSMHLRRTKDLGFFIREARGYREVDTYTHVRKTNYDLNILYFLAELTLSVTTKDLPYLREVLVNGDDSQKYWALVNCAILARRSELNDPPKELVDLLYSDVRELSLESAYVLCYTPKRELAFKALAKNTKTSLRVFEILSFDSKVWSIIPEDIKKRIRSYADNNCNDNNEALRARKVLVNTGELDADKIFFDEKYDAGLEININRKPLLPLP